jgi:hypothetical protein
MGVLLMLTTIGGLIVAVVLLAVSLFTKKTWLTKFTLGGVAVWFVFYVVMLFGFSFASTEKMLAMNDPKEYCGFYLDCHLHTVVTGVRTAKQVGDQNAQGTFYVVRVKVFSDARNPNIALRLLKPKAEVTDSIGRTYTRDTEAESLLPTAQVPLDQDIKNDQTIEKEIVFDVAESANGLRLLVTEGYGIDKYIEAVLVDDEDSILHKRTYFKIAEQNERAGVK